MGIPYLPLICIDCSNSSCFVFILLSHCFFESRSFIAFGVSRRTPAAWRQLPCSYGMTQRPNKLERQIDNSGPVSVKNRDRAANHLQRRYIQSQPRMTGRRENSGKNSRERSQFPGEKDDYAFSACSVTTSILLSNRFRTRDIGSTLSAGHIGVHGLLI